MDEESLDQPIRLTIRFTATVPDLPLTISTPSATSTVSLKQQIRTHLPTSLSNNRLRLIHAGKVLLDTTSVTTSLRLPPASPTIRSAKGKTPERPVQNFYIHCSISDPLSSSELQAEIDLADSTTISLKGPSTTEYDNNVVCGNDLPQTSTISTPRGFDRLLGAGFTAIEIASLRSQFLAIQAHTHTPDTMPSAFELRTLEDRWIDNTNTSTGGSGSGDSATPGVAGGAPGDDAEGGSGGLDDMLWGNIMGFFWPIGSVIWLLREEGVWTKRRQIAVVTGFLVNVAFSVLRVTS